MRYSQAFIPTLKEVPKDATTPSHIMLLRAGYMRMVGAGIYELLPLGVRVLRALESVVREEMNGTGAQEILMPALLPAEYFQESGRWDSFGEALLRLQDRRGGEYHLGPTHEEIITDLIRRTVHSYRQLPINLYQIQTKFRDEARPRAGLLRCREFLMKDAYSFDLTVEAAHGTYERMRAAYRRIFERLGLEYRVVEADSGAMGGSTSAEFQVLAQNGEDAIVACTACEYAANVEVAEAHHASGTAADGKHMLPIEKLHTPDVHTIDEIVDFVKDGTRPETTLKSLLYVAQGSPVMAVVRGDHEVNETKLARHLAAQEVRLATDEEVQQASGAAVGFAGPVGFKGRIIADRAVAHVLNAVTGANETDHHLKNVNLKRDFDAEVCDLRAVNERDSCPRCERPLKLYRGIEGGHIFILGTHYSATMGATCLGENGEKRAVVMGCYGIGISRLMAAAVEQYNDADGILWPMSVAPYQVILTELSQGADGVGDRARELYEALLAKGVDVLYDDRDERPGVKFKDADLLGIPVRVTVGSRALRDGCVELKRRTETETVRLDFADAADAITAVVVELGGHLSPGRALALA